MGVFHHIANRAIRTWSQASLRLQKARIRLFKSLSWHLNRRCSRLIRSARRIFVLDSILEALSQNRASASTSSTRLRNTTAPTKHSFGQTLIHQWYLKQSYKRLWLCVILSILLVGTCFGQRFYSEPSLDVGAIAPQTFYATETATFEDEAATQRKRSSAREGAVPRLKVDEELTKTALRSLDTILRQGTELRARAGNPPFLNPEIISKPTQDFLFQASEAQWKTIWQLAASPTLSSTQLEQFAGSTRLAPPTFDSTDISSATDSDTDSGTDPGTDSDTDPGTGSGAETSESPLTVATADKLEALDTEEINALRELVAYRELSGSDGLATMKIRIGVPRRQYRKAAAALALAASTEGQPLYNYRLFELSEAQWLQMEEDARQIFYEMMLQGIPEGIPDEQLRRAIEARVESRSSPRIQQLTVDVIAAAAAPNIVTDEAGTKQLAEQAMEKIEPVMVSVQEGELIVAAGDTINEGEFARLDHLGLTSRYFNWIGLSGFSVLTAGVVALYLWVDHLQCSHLSRGDHALILLLCLVVALLAALGVPAAGLPLVGLLVGSFYGAWLAITVVTLLVSLLLLGTPVEPVYLMAGAAAALVGAWIAPQLRAREEFALLGGFVGLTQGTVHLILILMRSTAALPLWRGVFLDSALHGLYGIAWSIVAMGVSPYLEHFFDVVTPIRLAELANPNRPLLKRLSAEAPGTFQHTMFVANLAEAAARALGRNVELVRAGTLYHDIGKMHDPQGFIENQMGGPNKHDELDDPWLSASIIKKHVTQGLVMARKYRLPKAVQAFIPEHQGDMKISYFYHQAKVRQAQEPSLVVNDIDFTYDGPIPQSPETGITMLADSCEAALRSLTPEASIDDAYKMVDKILRARWRNRQLVDSGLSRDDMDLIASVFIQVWQQHNHKRIAYPKESEGRSERLAPS